MNLVPEAAAIEPQMRDWRHHLHAHPETAFEEQATAAYVAERLRSFGLEVHTGLAKTGVVGVLRQGSSERAIGLRADLDALHIQEASGVVFFSRLDNIFLVLLAGVWLVFRRSSLRWQVLRDFCLILLVVLVSYYLRIQAPTNLFKPRREAMAAFMLKRVQSTITGKENGEGFIVSPTCKMVLEGLREGYVYGRILLQGRDAWKEEPVKNEWSHYLEACQYPATLYDRPALAANEMFRRTGGKPIELGYDGNYPTI